MTPEDYVAYVVYLDPGLDLDIQRHWVEDHLLHRPGRVVEEHIGGLKAAERSAVQLGAELLRMEAEPDAPPPERAKPNIEAKRRRSQERYEKIRGYVRQAKMLDIDTNTGIARFLTQKGVPLPSGKQGKWQAIQVKRALEWLGEVDK